jgi:hypothetical protein
MQWYSLFAYYIPSVNVLCRISLASWLFRNELRVVKDLTRSVGCEVIRAKSLVDTVTL